MYLALDDSRIVGLITFQTNFIDCLYISLVIVHPDFRRCGIARALIERVAAHSQNGKLFSSAEIDNEASIRMHRALGFQPSGYIDNLPQEKRELIFSRDLAPHACGEPFP